MTTTRTYSTCENEIEIDGICKYAVKSLDSDDLHDGFELYIVYYCSLARPARCQVYITDDVIN
jgi:hypothetical protein